VKEIVQEPAVGLVPSNRAELSTFAVTVHVAPQPLAAVMVLPPKATTEVDAIATSTSPVDTDADKVQDEVTAEQTFVNV